jgi:hypothetical protein
VTDDLRSKRSDELVHALIVAACHWYLQQPSVKNSVQSAEDFFTNLVPQVIVPKLQQHAKSQAEKQS